jgi:hypothetical protein
MQKESRDYRRCGRVGGFRPLELYGRRLWMDVSPAWREVPIWI